jgi:hypothetical protein
MSAAGTASIFRIVRFSKYRFRDEDETVMNMKQSCPYAPRLECIWVWVSGDTVPRFLTSQLDRGEWLASGNGCFNSRRNISRRYPLNRRLGGPKCQSGRCGEDKNLAKPGIEPGPSIPYPFAIVNHVWMKQNRCSPCISQTSYGNSLKYVRTLTEQVGLVSSASNLCSAGSRVETRLPHWLF